MTKKRVLTGDRPTGKLHLGHFVGSIQNRVALQEKYDCYFLIADLHMLTTKPSHEEIMQMREHIHDMVLDYLAVGIDPEKSTLYLQSAVPEIYELNLFAEMMVSINRLTGLPSIKEMAKNAHIDPESVPFGLIGYPVLQSADILLPLADFVPVGRDNIAHVEIARDIARRFNQLYGDLFPLPEPLVTETPSLIGTDGKGKMSKSAGNAISLTEEEKSLEKKVRSMYTDPNRLRADMPGTVEGNPVFIYHDLFNKNSGEVEDLKERYRKGTVGDVEVKEKLTLALNQFIAPIRERRSVFEKEKGLVEEILYQGTLKMREVAKETMKRLHTQMGIAGAWKKIERVAKERAKI